MWLNLIGKDKTFDVLVQLARDIFCEDNLLPSITFYGILVSALCRYTSVPPGDRGALSGVLDFQHLGTCQHT